MDSRLSIGKDSVEAGSVRLRSIRVYTWVIAACWTLVVAGSFTWYRQGLHQEIENLARAEARAAFGRDVLYRRWAASHGGVYVPASKKSPPNPYLGHIPERDITTPSGKQLTLVNPAYMTRQVYESAMDTDNVGRGHITSLKPLRPENAPDPWEAAALRSFETGNREVFEVHTIDGVSYMRLMRPFVTEQSCLKCHAIQGYRVGEIRGGISVSVPMQPYVESSHKEIRRALAGHGLIWITGIGLIGFGSRKLAHSTGILLDSETRYRTVADFTSDWEYWIAPDNTFRYVSPSCVTVCGYDQNEFYDDTELLTRIVHPYDRELYKSHAHYLQNNGSPVPIDFRIICKDGQVRWVSHVCRDVTDASGNPLGRRASNRDITDRKLAEEQLHQQAIELEEEIAERQQAQEALQEQAALLEEEVAERQQTQEELAIKQQQLETLNASLETRIAEAVSQLRQKDQLLIQQGRLAAMGEMIHNIAHQWRQPLNNVGLIIQNLQLSFLDGSLTKDDLDKEIATAMHHIVHMSRTIDDFRNFFSADKEKHGFIINNAVTHALDFIGATLANCGIHVDVTADGIVTAIGYQNEYSQVLLNILGNARDVLMERRTAAPAIHISITSEGGCSVVTVFDNGGGIEDAVLPKIFDPYFTTKEQGRGTGIGLYMSKAIIEQNMGGHLTARNAGNGAEFRIEV